MSAPTVLDGWFCDRAPGRGKPVYSSGTTIVPTNGIVGVGVSGALTGGTFAVPTTTPIASNLLNGWFVDRAPGDGKPVYAAGTTVVPTNGIVASGTGAPYPAGPGGKYYFEITIVAKSAAPQV